MYDNKHKKVRNNTLSYLQVKKNIKNFFKNNLKIL